MAILTQNQCLSENTARRAPHHSPSPDLPVEPPTLACAAQTYLSFGGESRFLKPLLERFGGVRLTEISQFWAESAVRRLYPTVSPSTRNREFWTPLIAMLNAAQKNRLCSEIKLTRPKIGAAASLQFFHPAEAQKIIDHSAPHLARQLRFMLCTGARPGELFNLRWDAVDTRTGKVRLPSYDAKVSVILPTELLGDLIRHGDQTQLVFGHHDGRRYAVKEDSGGQNKTSLRTSARRARIEPFTLTHIRQTWATWWLALNGDDDFLYAARWSSYRSATRYSQIPGERLTEVRRALLNEEMEICRLFQATHWPGERGEAP